MTHRGGALQSAGFLETANSSNTDSVGRDENQGKGEGRLALAAFAQDMANALLGLAGLTDLAAVLLLDPLHRGQKPHRFRLGK
jgi:ABC-type transporter lipoprotein component MlaA